MKGAALLPHERQVVPHSGKVSGRLGGLTEKQAGPAGAGNTKPDPNPKSGTSRKGLDMSIPMPATELGQKDLAHIFLKLISEQYQEACRHRVEYARWARRSGLTYREIAGYYGVSEDAIRKMLKRAEGESASP